MDIEQEKELVELAKSDTSAFDKLYTTNYDKILNYIAKRVGNYELAQDITSEVFIIAMKKLWQFKWRGVRFSSWLYRIAINQMNLHFRKNKVFMPVSLELLIEESGFMPIASDDIQQEIIENQDKIDRETTFNKIREQINKMSPKYQDVITLKYFENKKIKEIAEILNKKEGTVKSLLSRGIADLRKQSLNSQKKTEMQPFKILNIINNREAKL